MSELYLKASEIRERSKLTISDFSTETGLSESTIKRILKDPCYKGSLIAAKLINELYQIHIKSPFPERIEALDITHKIMLKRFSKLEYKEYGDPCLRMRLEFDVEYRTQSLADARINWLLGHLSFERANYLRLHRQDNFLEAVAHYRSAYNILQAERNPTFSKYLCQIKMSSIAGSFNILSPDERHSTETKHMLTSLGFVDDAESLLSQQPWQYVVARNALVVCSLLEDLERAKIFAEHLVKLSPNFFESGFRWSPEFLPATSDPDLKWFMDKRHQAIHNRSSKRE
jgi:lambda repressor-like predicted transcriptional regulator